MINLIKIIRLIEILKHSSSSSSLSSSLNLIDQLPTPIDSRQSSTSFIDSNLSNHPSLKSKLVIPSLPNSPPSQTNDDDIVPHIGLLNKSR